MNNCFAHTVNYENKIVSINAYNKYGYAENIDLSAELIKSIVTKEQMKSVEYKIEEVNK